MVISKVLEELVDNLEEELEKINVMEKVMAVLEEGKFSESVALYRENNISTESYAEKFTNGNGVKGYVRLIDGIVDIINKNSKENMELIVEHYGLFSTMGLRREVLEDLSNIKNELNVMVENSDSPIYEWFYRIILSVELAVINRTL